MQAIIDPRLKTAFEARKATFAKLAATRDAAVADAKAARAAAVAKAEAIPEALKREEAAFLAWAAGSNAIAAAENTYAAGELAANKVFWAERDRVQALDAAAKEKV